MNVKDQHQSVNSKHEEGCDENCKLHKEADIHEGEIDSDMHPEQKKERQSFIDGLLKELEALPDAEAKLKHVIDFMESSLAQPGSPHFKSFWLARGVCLDLFKENISPTTRPLFWAKYSELSKEARRLKDLLDEQSSFAIEQVEIAIHALESDISQLDLLPDSSAMHLEISCKTLEKNADVYRSLQAELNLLNTYASRVNAFRKELIKTDMRVRKKNKFFQRLSAVGDKVFPRRKDLIKNLSETFTNDVDRFITTYFSHDEIHESLLVLREEIKALQSAAKLLTLNTHAFTHMRMRLSECWDKIRVLDKERKKVRAQQKTVFKQNVETVLQKIEECSKAVQEGQLSPNMAHKKLDDVLTFMRSVELGRDELKYLRDQVQAARKPLMEQIRMEEQKRHDLEQERLHVKQQKALEIKREIDTLMRSVDIYTAEQLMLERKSMIEKINNSALTKPEKQSLERLLKPLRELIADKKVTMLSDDDRQALNQLHEILQEKKELRQEIKDQLESLRKALGSSGLDFEKAMDYNAQVSEQKEHLEKINESIAEVERRIANLDSEE